MTMPLREKLVNDAVTALNGAINNSVTTITVDSGAVFPSTGNFRIRIGDEIMIVTARSTNDLTVVRGQEGTAAASHSDDDAVTAMFTAGNFNRWAQDDEALWGYSSVPPLGRIDNGSGTILTSSDFTWVNQGGATASDQNGTIFLRAPAASGENCRILKRTAPSPTYSFMIACQVIKFREGSENSGILFRESSTGKFITFGISMTGTIPMAVASYRFTNATTYAGTADLTITGGNTPYNMFTGKYFWIRGTDNNTNLIFDISSDGVEWITMLTVTRTTHMAGGPDEIGFYLNNNSSTNYQMGMRIAHWSTF